MKELRFPLLNKDQIEVRVGQVCANGCTLLLYKTSRYQALEATYLKNLIHKNNVQ